MGSLKLICLAGVSLACLEGARGTDSSSITATGSRVKCLDELNHYRLAAGFSAFIESQILPPKAENTVPSEKENKAELDQKFLDYACGSLQSASSASITEEATFAVHSQSGTDADCSAAVEYWKGAIVNFDSLPPEYQQNAAPYTNPQNVSFVALFNPQANAAVDCAYVTCQKTTTPPSSNTNGAGDSGQNGTPGQGGEQTVIPPSTTGPTTATTSPSTPDDTHSQDSNELPKEPQEQQNANATESLRRRRLAATGAETGTGGTDTQKTNLLVCVTKPAALTIGQKPFSEQEFQKITKALSNSASAAVSASLSLFAASLALLFL
ncbi:hypothetical protein Emed_002940 [Eimeria media]